MMNELRQGVRDEGRSRKSGFAERGSGVGIRLDNKGNNREQRRVSSKSKGNGTELRGKRQPSNNTVGEETMAASVNGRRSSGTRGSKRQIGRRAESERHVCQQSVEWIYSSGGGRTAKGWSGSDGRGVSGETLKGIV
jgi:hypothetical protein